MIILLHARSLNEEGAPDPVIQNLDGRHSGTNRRLSKYKFTLEQVSKVLQSPQQLMAYDWRVLEIPGKASNEKKLHYVDAVCSP